MFLWEDAVLGRGHMRVRGYLRCCLANAKPSKRRVKSPPHAFHAVHLSCRPVCMDLARIMGEAFIIIFCFITQSQAPRFRNSVFIGRTEFSVFPIK